MRTAATALFGVLILAVAFVLGRASVQRSDSSAIDDGPSRTVVIDQRGAALPRWNHGAYGDAELLSDLDDLVAVGVTHIEIIPTWYQTDPEAPPTIEPGVSGRTPSDESMRIAIDAAHERGLQVVMKPHVDLTSQAPRNEIDPRDEQAWFDTYIEMTIQYGRLAEETGVSQFIVGTELSGTSRATASWKTVIDRLRRVYSGPVGYAANYDEYPQVRFWDALDFIGIDAYWPLSEGPTTDVDALVQAWEPIRDELAELSARWNRPVIFTEAGYGSYEGATTTPYISAQGPESEAEQAAAYQALFQVFSDQPWFGGVYWWMWFDTGEVGYTPKDKQAAEVLRRHWLEQ